MSRIGVVTAPVKCEENLRTPVEIKQEQCDDEDAYGEPHAKHPADSSTGKPSSSSMSAAEAGNSYEFLGHMKYEADESTDLTAIEPLSAEKRDIVCPLCQQVYYTKTYYGYHRKREFITHLIKVHDYSHLHGNRVLAQCKGCKIKKERWTFVVGEGDNYKFSNLCSRCQGYQCGPIPKTDNSDGLPHAMSRTSTSTLWKQFMAHRELNAEHQEGPEATVGTPTAAEKPDIQAGKAADVVITEDPSSKKRDGGVCHLCRQVYYNRTDYGSHKKRAFVAHLVKTHDYRHLRGHRGPTRCRRCGFEKERWTFVVGEGDNYQFSDECSTCRREQGNTTSQQKTFMAHRASNAELREHSEATAETPTAGEEPAASETHLLPQQ